LSGKRYNGKGYDKEGNIIYELKNGNGTVREYNLDNILIYEGEYLNAKRHGKGKEYNNEGQLIFEGEYVNGIKWNGKTFDDNNIYELKDGTGFIIENDIDDIGIFKGKYINGKKNGKGKEYYFGQLKYEGEYCEGKKHGRGKEYDFYGGNLIFEGEYSNGKRNGKGKEYYDNGKLKFEGEYLNGERNGKGIEYDRYADSYTFECNYLNGKKNGILFKKNNLEYFPIKQGEYLNRKKIS